MTIDRIALKELVEKGSDADLLREMIAFIAGRMMELEVEGLTGAGHGERLAHPHQSTQRLPRADLGDTRRHRAAGDPQAQEGHSWSRAAPARRR